MSELSDDPLWFKDAIIYEVYIRAFQDSNGDGIGDITGLIARLDYLADLGVTAIWLLPFYPSPLRDGGYDIADYTSVHPDYGTLEDFARLLGEAHARGIRVITELVLNHTSSDHPWFQRARRAPRGSPQRDFYVWGDDPTRYADTRIIFKDYETSNWAWDPLAGQYYWHRFYTHQPDLNFDNPAVHDALFAVIDFWLELGVDGMRLDAVPYLYEREGTSCENLAETHAFLKQLRAHIDGKFKNRMLLAEANQWPADAAAYFGDGDECQMNFHFPLMPRMFMAIELEDSFPITNILVRTPEIPESCQWATFLRNHDELTLEMVTDEDRDTMYSAYAAERPARLNLGIRRRLAPLLRVRRKIELMHALLLSLPGTPVLYYGDEIGMGDNIYLGDRDGVRTPMQWSGDRNGGFSRANPQKLYLPTIIDPEYHYEAINVEAQQANPQSQLWWTKRLIAKRKEHQLFGRGGIEFVTVDNPRVLAFVREHAGERLLVVANLSRFVQVARLGLEHLRSITPIELFGRERFPEVGESPYFVSLGAYDFFWLQLEQPTGAEALARVALVAHGAWTDLLAPQHHPQLARALGRYVAERRWYRSRSRARTHVAIADVIPTEDGRYAIALVRIEYELGPAETYVVPLAFAEDAAAPDAARSPHHLISPVTIEGVPERGTVTGLLFDALAAEPFDQSLLDVMARRTRSIGRFGELTGVALSEVPAEPMQPRLATLDQNNTSVLYGDRLFLKLFRVLEDGPGAEYEMARYLSSLEPPFTHAPRLLGVLEYVRPTPERSTLGTLFEYIPNQGDAWHLSLDAVDRYFDRVLAEPTNVRPPVPARGTVLEQSRATPNGQILDWVGAALERVRLLGTRTAELHVALASEANDPLFVPEPCDLMHQQSLYGSAVAHAARTFDALRRRLPELPPDTRARAEEAIARELELDRRLARVAKRRIDVVRTRIHGNYNLSQVLWTGADFVIIDFESEPGRPLTQRRFKRSPLSDVAGMIRSLHRVSAAALVSGRHRADDIALLDGWARDWSAWTSAAFFAGYLDRARESERSGAVPRFVPATDPDIELLLEFYLLEKCIAEIADDLANRPEWVDLPLRGLLALLGPRTT